jgi:hypothetical protein
MEGISKFEGSCSYLAKPARTIKFFAKVASKEFKLRIGKTTTLHLCLDFSRAA